MWLYICNYSGAEIQQKLLASLICRGTKVWTLKYLTIERFIYGMLGMTSRGQPIRGDITAAITGDLGDVRLFKGHFNVDLKVVRIWGNLQRVAWRQLVLLIKEVGSLERSTPNMASASRSCDKTAKILAQTWRRFLRGSAASMARWFLYRFVQDVWCYENKCPIYALGVCSPTILWAW